MTITVKLTANFEHNLAAIEAFLDDLDASKAYDGLLDELLDTLIPNLESFPTLGRPYFERSARSVEVTNALLHLKAKLGDAELREYIFADYLVLYAKLDEVIHLLSIRHHRQLSFDFQSLWIRN